MAGERLFYVGREFLDLNGESGSHGILNCRDASKSQHLEYLGSFFSAKKGKAIASALDKELQKNFIFFSFMLRPFM
ncbi:MAG: hypothetical protein HC799_17765 [Limnothrix sp. RL_2_0]|nr:hypothetical protein [Limnothrix sp. RL_2_0]